MDVATLQAAALAARGKHALSRRPATFVPLGDSTSVVPGTGVTYPELLSMLSGGVLTYPFNAGVAGNTTTQMLARVDTDVIAYAPSYCPVLGGTNDVGAATALATITGNLASIYAKLWRRGIVPVACTITPRNAATAEQAAVRTLNAWVRGYAAKTGLPLIDMHAALVDPATGFYVSSLNADNVHPNSAGAIAMAQQAWQVFGSSELTTPLPPSMLPMDWSETAYAGGFGDNYSLVLNPLMTDGDADLIPDRWTLQTTAGATYPAAVTATVVTDARFVGKALRWQSTVLNGFCTLKQVMPRAGWSVGDRLRLVFRFAVDSASGFTGSNGLAASVFYIGPSTTATAITQWTTAVPAGTSWVKTLDTTVPAATTDVQAQFTVIDNGSGTMDAKLGQVQVYNLTKLGLA